jgi:hypothetical protein
MYIYMYIYMYMYIYIYIYILRERERESHTHKHHVQKHYVFVVGGLGKTDGRWRVAVAARMAD